MKKENLPKKNDSESTSLGNMSTFYFQIRYARTF